MYIYKHFPWQVTEKCCGESKTSLLTVPARLLGGKGDQLGPQLGTADSGAGLNGTKFNSSSRTEQLNVRRQ